ncbi:MAG: MBL fold metallo-hydrolase [Nitrospinota bacterium]
MSRPELALTVLGSGDAFATAGRPYSSYLLEPLGDPGGGARAVLMDCGPTAVPMLMGMGFDMGRLDLILLSHLHGDHVLGMPFVFLDSQFRTKRDRPLVVAGPPGTEAKCEALFRLAYRDTLEHMGRRFEVRYRELPEGEESEVCGLRITPRKVVHQREEIPYGYRIAWRGRTIGWSGDTQWDGALVELARDADLFIVECFTAGFQLRYHTSAEDLEREKHRLTARRTLLTHMGETTLRRLAEGKLPFEAARDGQRIEL